MSYVYVILNNKFNKKERTVGFGGKCHMCMSY